MLTTNNHFSYSQISAFKMCREHYKILYLDGIRKVDESLEAFMGKCVHAVLEWVYHPRNIKKPYMTFDSVCKKYDKIWLKAWHDHIYIANPRNTTDEYYTIGKRCLANYYNKYGPVFEESVKGTEVELNFTINDTYKFRGVIDRLDNPSEGQWIIHDYKTGKHPKTERSARSDLQLALYQIAVESNFEPVDEVQLVWHFLRTGTEVKIVHDNDTLESIRKKTTRAVDKIIKFSEDKGNFYPKESLLCNWCYYWQECSAKVGQNPSMIAK